MRCSSNFCVSYNHAFTYDRTVPMLPHQDIAMAEKMEIYANDLKAKRYKSMPTI